MLCLQGCNYKHQTTPRASAQNRQKSTDLKGPYWARCRHSDGLGGASAYPPKADLKNRMSVLAPNPSAYPLIGDAFDGLEKSRLVTLMCGNYIAG